MRRSRLTSSLRDLDGFGPDEVDPGSDGSRCWPSPYEPREQSFGRVCCTNRSQMSPVCAADPSA